jgi:hypothetical protein
MNGFGALLAITYDHLFGISPVTDQPFLGRAGHLFVQETSASIEKDVPLFDNLAPQSSGKFAA